MTAPKPGTPLTNINFSVADDGHTECTDHRRAYETSCLLEQDRARLIGALKECVNANYSQDVDNKCYEAIELLRELGELE